MIEIIPAMDIIAGRCVRLEKGDFSKKTEYAADPVDVARQFEAAGLRRLHMVDLDGAKAGEIRNADVLRRVADATSLKIDFSGGIRTEDDLGMIFEAGATFAAVGSAAVKDRQLVTDWLSAFGPQKFVLGADVRGTKLAVQGWQEQTDLDLFDHLGFHQNLGVDQVFITDISRDGVMLGPSSELYGQVIELFPDLHLIASGGVRNTTDIDELAELGCSGVIIGKAIYEGAIKLDDLAIC